MDDVQFFDEAAWLADVQKAANDIAREQGIAAADARTLISVVAPKLAGRNIDDRVKIFYNVVRQKLAAKDARIAALEATIATLEKRLARNAEHTSRMETRIARLERMLKP